MSRAKFSRLAVELHLRSKLETLERWLLRDYNHRINLADPVAPALRGGMPPREILLIGQWVTTRELLDDLVEDLVQA